MLQILAKKELVVKIFSSAKMGRVRRVVGVGVGVGNGVWEQGLVRNEAMKTGNKQMAHRSGS